MNHRSAWMNLIDRTVAGVILLAALVLAGRAEENRANAWSADLLSRILKAEVKTDAKAPAASRGEMTLRTYHFEHLRVGEAGKAQNLFVILEKLLPSGSSVNPDVAANCIHVLTTDAAHKAVWDYLSAVDVPDRNASIPALSVPEEVKAALKKLADASDQSTRLARAIDGLKTDVSAEIARIDAQQRHETLKLAGVGGAFGMIVVLTVFWTLRRRAAANTVPEPSTALALAPERLTSALAPVHDRMRNEMLSVLNEVAIKLQAQHNEQQKLVLEQQKQIEDARLALADERQQFISQTGTMVVEAVERVDATTAKLVKQQDKVAELVQELQHTVRELDQTKDSLRTREVELQQERAKIAALSILLEDGTPLRGTHGLSLPGAQPEDGSHEGLPLNHDRGATSATFDVEPSPLCINPIPNHTNSPARRLQFLPPNDPEN